MVVSVEGTEFTVKDGLVAEVGTTLRYDPSTGCGFQLVDGRRVGLGSYAAFGDDFRESFVVAGNWIRKAKWAWELLRDPERHDENERLQVENAKLRDLCWCLLEAERIGETSRGWRELHDRARELGIEVAE